MLGAHKKFDKKEYKIEIIAHPKENKFGTILNNSSNHFYLFNKQTNIVSGGNNNIGYILDEPSQIINSSKLKFENDETEEKSNHIYRKNKTNNNSNIRLDMDILKTYVKSKTDKIKHSKMNSSTDTI